jgi:hypothetical protein
VLSCLLFQSSSTSTVAKIKLLEGDLGQITGILLSKVVRPQFALGRLKLMQGNLQGLSRRLTDSADMHVTCSSDTVCWL